MYKIVLKKKFVNVVNREEIKFENRKDAEDFFENVSEKPEIIDIGLYCCLPYRDDIELTRYIKSD